MQSIMTNKAKKSGVVLMTLVSALLFCSFIVVSSLSPLADSGPTANEFNSLGMWAAIGFVLALYIIPLIIYVLGVDAMRIVMAVLCGFGLLIGVLAAVGILLFGAVTDTMPALMGVISVSIAMCIANVIWFFVAFRTSAAPGKV